MNEDRIDFSLIDPLEDDERFEQLVGAITERAAYQLAERRARYSAVGQVAQWWRPMLAAAAVLLIMAVTTLARVDGPVVEVQMAQAVPSDDEVSFAVAVGVPQQFAQWIGGDEAPTPAELLTVEIEQ